MNASNASNVVKYVAITLDHTWLQTANLAFALVGILLTIGMALILGVSLWDVLLGLVVSTLLGGVIGFMLPITFALVGKVDWFMNRLASIANAVGPAVTVLGVACFAGFPAALLIVLAPMLITQPAFALFRAWAIRKYG